jgi:hypothetical protein
MAVSVWESIADADTVGFVLDVGGLGLVVLMVHQLDVGQGFGSASYEKRSPPQQVEGRPVFLRISVRQREVATPDQASDFFAVDGIGLGFSSVDGFHEQGVTEDEREMLIPGEISQPIPVERGFTADDQVRAKRLEGCKQFRGVLALKVLVQQFLAGSIYYADVECLGMEIDPAVELVLLRVEFHHASP